MTGIRTCLRRQIWTSFFEIIHKNAGYYSQRKKKEAKRERKDTLKLNNIGLDLGSSS